MAVPSGTVTFLFTDIVGSTRLWQMASEAMPVALARHDAIVRSAVEAHGGYVFSTGGDGFGIAFARAGEAIAAAVEAQGALGAETWPQETPIRVRMGLHTGEVTERGGDYFGTAVNQTARLMTVGHGGQVLCSAITAGLVEAEIELSDLGEHRLRDLSATMHVFQVGGGSFAALRSLNVLPGNVPSLASSFVGRREELAAVAKLLSAERLVTLTGVGGVGKTRLALQVAGDVVVGFADGAWVCELATASSVDDLARVVAIALGVSQRHGMEVAESIVDFLRPRQLLVVLDNCEHLLDAAAELVERVLAGAPAVRILATSQEGLGIAGEHVWPLRSLPVAADAGDARSSDAVALFVERARSVSPGFVLDVARTEGVVEVCRRLDGIPLAIELAAARVGMMTPAEIAGHLDERFRLLTGGRRGRVKRHQTLYAALEWSYSLLSGTERGVFDGLGVFPASFDEAAAVAVCGGDGVERWDVIDALASLVAKSMVVADTAGDTTRYQLLETLRHFARDRAGGDLDGLRRRHAAHYAAFAERAGAGLASPDELAWRPQVAADLDNLRAAASWAFEAPSLDDVVLGVRVLDGLSPEAPTLYSTGMYAMASTAVPRVQELNAAQRCVVYNAAAHASMQLGHYQEAKELGSRTLAESDTVTFAWTNSLAIVSLAALAMGDPAAAMAVVADARRRVESDGASDWLTAGMHSLTSFVAGAAGDHETARSAAEENLAIARRVGAPTMLVNALSVHALHIAEQDPQAALAPAEEVIGLIEAGAADIASYNIALRVVAMARTAGGDSAAAARAVQAAVEHEARRGRRDLISPSIRVAALVLAASPSGFEAAACLIGALDGPVLGHYADFVAGSVQERYDRAVADTVAALGQRNYTNATQRGKAMTYDDIVAFTLHQIARLAGSGT
jgi:predicted ATPase/class 3 adenylate cyclase